MSSPTSVELPDPTILEHIIDVHCHPTDAPSGVPTESMGRLQISICAMSTMLFDQERVKALASKYPAKVTPGFGHHPWFSHWISTETSLAGEQRLSDKERHYRNLFLPSGSDPALPPELMKLLPNLPEPVPLASILDTLKDNLSHFPNAIVGEVGLDRVFRVPVDYSTSPRMLTPFRIPLQHQIEILESQLSVALEMGRNVSLHSVKSQLATVELLDKMKKLSGDEKWRRISLDMHSCGFSKQTWMDLERKHENVFMSLSMVINHKHSGLRELIAACSPDRLLVESDYNDINMVTSETWNMVKFIAEVRGWPIESQWHAYLPEEEWGVVRRLERNWKRFRDGNHAKMKDNQRRRINDRSLESELNCSPGPLS